MGVAFVAAVVLIVVLLVAAVGASVNVLLIEGVTLSMVRNKSKSHRFSINSSTERLR